LLALVVAAALPAALGVAWARALGGEGLPGPSAAYALRGVLPWSDAFDYWSAAQHLMQHGVLDEWGSRRPLNGAWLAVRLGLANDALWAALLLQSVALGMVTAGLIVVVSRRMGLSSALIGAAALVAVGAIVQCTLQSEALGLLLGAAALALLLRGAHGDGERDGAGVVGLALLSLAMAARPGAMFVLPAIGLWLVWRHRTRWLVAVIAVVLALAAGSAADRAARALYGSPSAAGNANFATTVLGLARGTDYYEADRWLHETHPEADAAAHANEAYAESWRLIRDAPTTFVASLARNEWRFVARMWPLLLLAAIGLWRAPRSERGAWSGERGLWALGWLGILASAPVIFGDGGIRVLAVTWPFMIVSAASALRRRAAHDVEMDRLEARAARVAAGVAIVVVALTVVGPALFRAMGVLESVPTPGAFGRDAQPRDGAQEVDWVRGLPALHAIAVVDADDDAAARVSLVVEHRLPVVTPAELMREPAVIEFGEPLDRIPTPFLLCVVYDVNQSRARVFTLPLDEATNVALRCGRSADPCAGPPRVLRIDSNALRPGGRVRVGRSVESAE